MYIVIYSFTFGGYSILKPWEEVFDDEIIVFGPAYYEDCLDWIDENA